VDGVELHSHESFLHAQMLNPLWNTRSDEYGGPLENRMRFLVETLRAMRAGIGPDLPLGVRLKLATAFYICPLAKDHCHFEVETCDRPCNEGQTFVTDVIVRRLHHDRVAEPTRDECARELKVGGDVSDVRHNASTSKDRLDEFTARKDGRHDHRLPRKILQTNGATASQPMAGAKDDSWNDVVELFARKTRRKLAVIIEDGAFAAAVIQKLLNLDLRAFDKIQRYVRMQPLILGYQARQQKRRQCRHASDDQMTREFVPGAVQARPQVRRFRQ